MELVLARARVVVWHLQLAVLMLPLPPGGPIVTFAYLRICKNVGMISQVDM
jgi:hypothetical protein